jgi:branched-chain amino acid transport system substrate-binding protein
MTKTGKIIGTLIVIIVIVAIVLGVTNKGGTNKTATKEKPVIKIGVIVPLTGSLAFIGEAAKNGVDLAVDKINNDTTLTHKYEVIVEDDAFDAKKTASAINKLTGVDKVNAVVSLSSTGGNVVAPIAEETKLPHIGLASDPNVAKGDYNFIHWTRPQEEVDLLITELKKLNLTKVAIIGVKQQGFQAINDDFKAKAKTNGITVVADESFNSGDRDFKAIVTKVQKLKPDIYLLGAFTPELEILGKQMKDLGIKTPLTSIESFGLSGDPTVFEGSWFIDASVSTSGFNDQYRTKVGKEVGPSAANVYDAVNLFVQATENTKNSGVPTGKEIVDQLSKLNSYTGALGALSVTPDGAFISQPSVKIIKDGKAVETK